MSLCRKFKYTKLGCFKLEIANGKQLKFIGFSIDIGSYDSDELQLGINLGILHIWIGYSSNWIFRTLGKVGKLLGRKYGRSYNSHVHIGRYLSLEIFGDSCGEEPLFKRYIDLVRIVTGRPKHSIETIKTGETTVIMPEKEYKATYQIDRRTNTFPRWFKNVWETIEIKVEGGIPHQGKGENSWDCGMDATHSISTVYKGSLRGATDKFAMDILKTRQRHSKLSDYSNLNK